MTIKAKERLAFWANIAAVVYNSIAAIVTGMLGITILMVLGIVSAVASAAVAWWLWRRSQKRKRIAQVIREAEEAGLYEAAEHYTSHIDLDTDD